MMFTRVLSIWLSLFNGQYIPRRASASGYTNDILKDVYLLKHAMKTMVNKVCDQLNTLSAYLKKVSSDGVFKDNFAAIKES